MTTAISTADAGDDRCASWILCGLVLLALGLRLPGYTESLWFDELFTSDVYCGETLILKTLYNDIHPPTYFVFIHFWNSIFGDSEVFLRLPPLICGLLSIVLIYRLGRLFAGRSAGLFAAFLMAVSPVHIWYSQEARPYATNMFLILATTLAFYELMGERKRFWWWVVFSVGLVLVVFTHYYIAAFPAVYAVLAWWRKSPNRGRILFSCLTVVVLVAAYIGAKSHLSNVPTSMTYLRAFDELEAWKLLFTWFLTGNALVPVDSPSEWGSWALLAIQGLALVAFLRGCWRLAAPAAARNAAPAGSFGLDLVIYLAVVPVVLAGLTLCGFDQTYIERSALPSLPFFLVVLGVGLSGWRDPRAARIRDTLLLAAATVVVVAYFLHGHLWTVYKPNPDWRGAAALLGAEIDRAGPDAGIVLYSDYVSPTPLRYYDPRMQEAKRFADAGLAGAGKEERLLRKIAATFGSTGFPGRQIHGFVRDHLRAYAALEDAAKRGMRLEIRDLRKRDPRRDPRREAVADGAAEYWLLVHRDPSERARGLLADPRTTTLSVQGFRQLTLYKLRGN